jgi:hypothetical protein
VHSFFSGERTTYLVLAAVVGVVATYGALTLIDFRATDDH